MTFFLKTKKSAAYAAIDVMMMMCDKTKT